MKKSTPSTNRIFCSNLGPRSFAKMPIKYDRCQCVAGGIENVSVNMVQ